MEQEEYRSEADGEQNLDSPASSQRFAFLGGNLALDLVNTEIMVRGKHKELLMTARDAAQWWSEACRVYAQYEQSEQVQVWNEQQFNDLRSLRGTLRRVFEAVAGQLPVADSEMQALNAVLQRGYYALECSPDGKMLASYQPRFPEDASAVLPIAFAALSLLTERDSARLHVCQNEQCIRLFYDTTRSATRHWCSIACTNRARSRENYRRAKAKAL
jgi:predicted RNA-binding Zn ribbon-like protein